MHQPQLSDMPIVNIAAYKFVTLVERDRLKEDWSARCAALQLKGTIVLAPEGINLFLAGSRASIDAFLVHLRADDRFVDMRIKESVSEGSPFKRLRVRLKKEIITLKQPAARPGVRRAPAVTPAVLKTWLDRGHDDAGLPVVLLDTRNAYEVAAGAFEHAIDCELDRFTEFPQKLQQHRERFEDKTVVSYCTGGIRCEKAAIYMEAAGVRNVYQLEGGILNYFEQVGGAHFRGGCFVFDARGVLDTRLLPQSPSQ